MIWLSLEELGQQADLDPLLTLLTLPARPEAELPASTQQILELRPDLLSTVLTMLFERFPTLTPEEIMVIAGIPTDQLLHTRAAQILLDRGREEGLQEGEAQGEAKLTLRRSTAVAAPSARPPPPASRRCRWTSWRPWQRRCLSSAAQPTWPLGWKSTRPEAQEPLGLQVVKP